LVAWRWLKKGGFYTRRVSGAGGQLTRVASSPMKYVTHSYPYPYPLRL
jgi:hypothetical protein